MNHSRALNWKLFDASAVLVVGVAGFWGKDFLRELFEEKRPEKTHKTRTPQVETPKDAISILIKGRLAEVQRCYNEQLRQGNRKSGVLIVKWFVNSFGEASDFLEEQNDLNSTEFFDCTVTAIRSWPFPKNRATYIRYTFRLRELVPKKQEPPISNVAVEESDL